MIKFYGSFRDNYDRKWSYLSLNLFSTVIKFPLEIAKRFLEVKEQLFTSSFPKMFRLLAWSSSNICPPIFSWLLKRKLATKRCNDSTIFFLYFCGEKSKELLANDYYKSWTNPIDPIFPRSKSICVKAFFRNFFAHCAKNISCRQENFQIDFSRYA